MCVLVVAAHPDDEVLGCGGTIARHAASGDPVHLLFMADGIGSRDTLITDNEGVARREKACQVAADALGVTSVTHVGFADNAMDNLPLLEVIKQVELVVDRIKPTTVYTHHASDLNVDHRLTHEAVMTACRPQPGESVRQIYTFEVLSSTEWQSPSQQNAFVPNRFVDTSAYQSEKRRALEAYEEEMRSFPHARSYEAVEALSRYRGASVGMPMAEAFVVMRDLWVDA